MGSRRILSTFSASSAWLFKTTSYSVFAFLAVFLQDLTSIFLRVENFNKNFQKRESSSYQKKKKLFEESAQQLQPQWDQNVKTQNKTKISSLLSSRTYNTPTQKEKNGKRQLLHCCCIFEENLFFSLSSSRVFWTISNKKIFIKTTPIYNSASKTLQIITNQKQCLLFTYCQMVVNASVIYYNQYWLSFDLCVFCSFHVVKWELPHQPHRFSRSPTPPPQHDCPPVPPPNLCARTPAVHALRALARFSRHFWASQQRRKPKQRLLKNTSFILAPKTWQ